MGMGEAQGEGYSIFCRLGSFFGVQNFEFQYFLGFSEKKIFFGMEELWIFFGSSHNWTIFRVHFYAFFGLFLRSRYRMGDIFWGC